MENRAGKWKTNLSGELAYESFEPAFIPPENPPIEIDDEMISLLIKANRQIAILDGVSSRIPNVNLFISMYVRKEALMSSQIEGIQATLEELLDPFIDENANQNISDVVNYIKATEFAISKLKELPLCNRLIRKTHAVLMEGVRGQEKSPGEFRKSQNWIGGQGSTLKDARYIPPNVEDMNGAMYLLEKLINDERLWNSLDVLIQSALIHYYFETVHPFLDGNGRIGRLLIALFLMERKVLSSPVLYISYFLKKNRIEYYDRMMEVRTKGNYEQWIKFFLLAVYESASDAIDNIDKLTELHNHNVNLIGNLSLKSNAVSQVFDYLESNPIIEIGKTAKAIGISYNTASSAIKILIENGILVQSAGGKRGRIFSYEKYLDILKSGT